MRTPLSCTTNMLQKDFEICLKKKKKDFGKQWSFYENKSLLSKSF
jgi:hypothetical protein